jgi:hypothetical protein
MNTQSNDTTTDYTENRGEQGAHTTTDDFTGGRRDSEKNTTNQPSEGSDAANGDSQAPKESELGHS